jgi:ElaB/YqjD/DUF883 family membrane-anchored ribosome-binding protein
MSEQALNHKNEKLLNDVRSVLNNTEELLAVASDEPAAAKELKSRLSANLRLAKNRLLDAEVAVRGKAKAAAKATDHYVHEHPWKAIGAAAGVAFLLGLLIGRRD